MTRSGKRIPVTRVFVYSFAVLVLAFLIFPIFVIVPVSFSSSPFLQFPPPGWSLRWYERFFGRPQWVDAAILSFWVAAVVMVLATVLGTAAAFALVRGHIRGRRWINSFILSPLIVPGIVVAIAIYFFYARLRLVGTPLGMILAHTALAVPYVVVNVTATLYGFDRRLEQAAMNLGANRWRMFSHVTLPLIRPGVLAGALFAFIASFDELIVAIFIAGAGAVTLPARMWEGVRMEVDPTIAAVATITIFISIAAFLSAALLERRARQYASSVAEPLYQERSTDERAAANRDRRRNNRGL
jgi:putative spermidine/putrescine transport system permease protein